MILEDNQSRVKMTKNPFYHGRAKHIDIKYHHIRDKVKRGEVKLEYCETTVMLADIMTKGLHGPRHKDLQRRFEFVRVRIEEAYYGLPDNPNIKAVSMAGFLRQLLAGLDK